MTGWGDKKGQKYISIEIEVILKQNEEEYGNGIK